MIVDAIVDIYRRVLETDDVEPGSDFFDIGGDSLLATRVLSAVARQFGPELSFDDFAAAPTPGGLAATIAAASAAAAA
jgi:acyl carrier protein